MSPSGKNSVIPKQKQVHRFEFLRNQIQDTQLLPNYQTKDSLREKCPYSEFFWPAFSRIRTEYEKIRTRKTPNMDTLRNDFVFLKIRKRRESHTKQYKCTMVQGDFRNCTESSVSPLL